MLAPFVEDAFYFPLYNFSFFVKNHVHICVFIGVWINIMVFDSIPLVHLSVFMLISRCFQYCSSITELDVKDGDDFRNSFILKDCSGYPGFFVFFI